MPVKYFVKGSIDIVLTNHSARNRNFKMFNIPEKSLRFIKGIPSASIGSISLDTQTKKKKKKPIRIEI